MPNRFLAPGVGRDTGDGQVDLDQSLGVGDCAVRHDSKPQWKRVYVAKLYRNNGCDLGGLSFLPGLEKKTGIRVDVRFGISPNVSPCAGIRDEQQTLFNPVLQLL